MGKTKIGKCAALCTGISFVLVVIAFTTPNWLESDGKLERPKFIKIGLWQVCFQGVQETQRLYEGTRFFGCWWVFEEQYYMIHNIVLPDFFVATQFFFTLCMTLLLVGSALAILYTCCSRRHDKYQLLLWATGSNLLLAGICGTIAVIIFAARGDGHDWMPDWEHNKTSWSFALAIAGSIFINSSGILFLAEAMKNKNIAQRSTGDTSRSHDTTI